MKPRKYLPPSMFVKSEMPTETIMSSAEYTALRQAALAKNKMAEFYSWQRNRKIILKGASHEST